MNYLQSLNERQLQAVTSNEKYIRVVAGAGSGKTKVLTSRISYLVENGVDPCKILAITFTNKASKEMKERVLKNIDDILGSPFISTFHSFCVRFLREEINALGYPKDFNIIDEEDKTKLVKEILKDKNIDKNYLNHKTIINYISYYKTYYYKGNYVKSIFNEEKEKDKKSIYEEYTRRLESMQCLDFDDLLLKTYQILVANDDVRAKWQRRFLYILVDEFQDTNDIQFDLVKLLVGSVNNLFVVGDPDQTIYTWRGANLNIIMEFNETFPGAVTIVLDTNYRSSKKILECANMLIKNNKNRLSKDLIAFHGEGDKVSYNNSSDSFSEASLVARTILEEKQKYDLSYSDFAILYRANYLSRDVEMALTRNGIPYKIYGGVKFYERKEIKDSLAYLRVLVNKNDNLSLTRIINEPKRGVGDTLLEHYREMANENNMSMYETIKNNLDECKRSEARNNLREFFEIIEKYTEQINAGVEIEIVLDGILKDTGYYQMIDDNEESDRRENIKELMNNITYFELNNEDPSLSSFLQEITLFSAQDEVETGEYVSLMTIHTAKGLEFKSVFIVGLCEGVFPSCKSLEESDDNLEEERRLAYVAFTRAMERLHLSSNYGLNYVVHSNNTPSRFIREIKGCLDINVANRYKEVGSGSGLLNKPVPTIKKEVKPLNNIDWHVGDKLTHAVYGDGIVLSVDGDLINIAFKNPAYGVKMLLGKHGSLSRV
jgi:DNA helicase-2/ATP-dependent DNA helicase PcrA